MLQSASSTVAPALIPSFPRPLLIAGTNPQVGQQDLGRVLNAYTQQHHPHPAQVFPLTPPLDLAALWSQVEALSLVATTAGDGTEHAPWSLLLLDHGLGEVVASETTVADLAWDWRLPVVVVVPVQPGCLGQAIAHVALARQSRCYLKGLVLACPSAETWTDRQTQADPRLFQRMTQVPVIGYLPPQIAAMQPPDQAAVAAQLNLERLWV